MNKKKGLWLGLLSFVCAVSVYENNTAVELFFGDTLLCEGIHDLSDGGRFQLLFFDARFNPEQTVKLYRDHLIFNRRRVASVGIPFLSQPRAA